jgi:hypothetical protein
MRSWFIALVLLAGLITNAVAGAPYPHPFAARIWCGPPRPCDRGCSSDIMIVITILPDGKVLWNNAPMGDRQLTSFIHAAVADEVQAPFLFKARGNVTYATFAKNLKRFQDAGIRHMQCAVPNG